MRRFAISVRVVVVAVAATLGGGAVAPPQANAQPQPEESAPEGPKQQGEALFFEGNALYLEGRYAEALARYEQALAIYDHPLIRLQVATTLGLDMRKPREAYPHLVVVLRQLDRLAADKQQEARRLESSLLGQLGFVKVRCETDAAEVTLDGEGVACDGEPLVVTAGRHQVVGKKARFLPLTEDVFVEPGKEALVTVRLVPLADAAEVRRRWTVWKPWAVVGAGAAIALVGVPFQLAARDNFDTFDTLVEQECGADRCIPMDSTLDLERRATLQNRVAISLFTAGAVAATSGLVLVYLNRERAVLSERRAAPGVSIIPLIAPHGGGVALAAPF